MAPGPEIRIMRLFQSHAGIEHLTGHLWEDQIDKVQQSRQRQPLQETSNKVDYNCRRLSRAFHSDFIYDSVSHVVPCGPIAGSEVSVQDSMMEHAYHSLQNAFSVQDGQQTFFGICCCRNFVALICLLLASYGLSTRLCLSPLCS